MLFSVYRGHGQMKNMMQNESTSIHFGFQMLIHQEPITSLIFYRGQAESSVPTEPLSNKKHTGAQVLALGFSFCYNMDGN